MQILEEWSLQEGQCMYLPTHWKAGCPSDVRRLSGGRPGSTGSKGKDGKLRESRDPTRKALRGPRARRAARVRIGERAKTTESPCCCLRPRGIDRSNIEYPGRCSLRMPEGIAR